MLFALGDHPKIVQARLEYFSIQVTLDTYSHMLPNMQEAVAESLESKKTRTLESGFTSDVTNFKDDRR
ncbi:hypothetical protein [Virgibacillus sp. Bac330]|uniref:hypothetical protein n=1 Tax=Virgibacillus sp. Bac330 TaxID=2419841 RepID=UPI000EF50B5B|nr:hypothetical protein [Virgibacillus sp. Bac330]